MNSISDPITINRSIARNRILMPALVCFNWGDNDGFATEDRPRHYGARARGGTGTIVIEATAVTSEGRLADTELGLWRDEHIEQFRAIGEACHDAGSLVLVQLVHAGMHSIGESVLSASEVDVKGKSCRAMTLGQIEQVKCDFVAAARRAQRAGLDGIEIHGAHGYLLSQFTSSKTNRRSDLYGGDLAGRLRLPLEIVRAVRQATSESFIIGYRFGVNDPTFAEDISFARQLERGGVDLLNVSSGIGAEAIESPPGFPYTPITYMGTEIHNHVTIPVASVCGVRLPKQAEDLLKNDLTDMVAVGRGLLADPEWTAKAIAGEPVNVCRHCRPRCNYTVDGHTCYWRLRE